MQRIIFYSNASTTLKGKSNNNFTGSKKHIGNVVNYLKEINI